MTYSHLRTRGSLSYFSLASSLFLWALPLFRSLFILQHPHLVLQSLYFVFLLVNLFLFVLIELGVHSTPTLGIDPLLFMLIA